MVYRLDQHFGSLQENAFFTVFCLATTFYYERALAKKPITLKSHARKGIYQVASPSLSVLKLCWERKSVESGIE